MILGSGPIKVKQKCGWLNLINTTLILALNPTLTLTPISIAKALDIKCLAHCFALK